MSTVFSSKNSRYTYGGITEESARFVEWWERVKIPPDVTDKYYVMEKQYEGRPDLLGTMLYGDPSLTWVVLQFNGILDPVTELVEGTVLRVPTLERVKKTLMAGRIQPVASSRDR